MSEAPERICIDPTSEDENGVFLAARPGHSVNIDVGYVSDDRIKELEAKLAKADALAAAVDRRMNDLGGFDNRFGLRKALQEYYDITLAKLKGAEDADRT